MNQQKLSNNEKLIKYAQLSPQQAEERGRSISNCTYQMHLDIVEENIYGVIVINFNCSVDFVLIDFCGEEIISISVNERKWSEQEIRDNWQKHQIAIRECQKENCISVQFVSKFSDNGFGLYRQQRDNNEIYIYSLFCPNYAHQCFPCFDQPAIKAEISLDVVCPIQWTVISNMNAILAEEITESERHWKFATTPKISTYLFSLNLGNWSHHSITMANGSEINLYCEQFKKGPCDRNLPLIKQCLQFGINYYESLFGIALPFKKQDLIFCSNFYFSGMEHPGAILISQNYLQMHFRVENRTSFVLVMLHELSHMWFGNLVTMKWWNDLWLNEAFAVYISYKALEEFIKVAEDQYQDATVHYLLYKQSGVLQDINPMTHPIEVDIQDANEGLQAFDSITYNKGSAVLCALVNQIGLEKFISIVSAYLKTYEWSNATTNDLFALISQQTKEIDIQRWKNEYIQQNGINVIEIGRQEDQLMLFQSGTTPSRQHLMNILLIKDKEITTLHVLMNQQSHLLCEKSVCDAAIINFDDSSYCISVIDPSSRDYLMSNFNSLNLQPIVTIQILNSLFQMSYILGKYNVQEFIQFVLSQMSPNMNCEILHFIIQKLIMIFDKITIKHKVTYGQLIFEKLQSILYTSPDITSTIIDQIGLFAITSDDIHFLYQEIENQSQQTRNLALLSKFLNCLFYKSHYMDQRYIQEYEQIWLKIKDYNSHLITQSEAALLDIDGMRLFFNGLLQQGANVHDLENKLKGMNNEYSLSYEDYIDTYLVYLPVLVENLDSHLVRVILNHGFPIQGDIEKQLSILDELSAAHVSLALTITKQKQILLQRRLIQQQFND